MQENENKETENSEVIQDQSLDGISGGYVFNAGAVDGRPNHWEVIDDFGYVQGTFETVTEAQAAARKLGYSDRVIGWRGELEKLRRGEYF